VSDVRELGQFAGRLRSLFDTDARADLDGVGLPRARTHALRAARRQARKNCAGCQG
jgi:hypothetical protein